MFTRLIRQFLIGVSLVALVAVATIIYALHNFTSAGPLAEPKTVRFERGVGFLEITGRLGAEGVIDHPYFFTAFAAITGDGRRFKAGEYRFSAGISPALVMKMIAEGDVVIHKITVPEGLTVKQVQAILEAEESLQGAFPADIKEGTLLPETYHFVYGDSRIDVVARMQRSMQQLLDELWAKKSDDLPIKTKEETLVLASIIEKETSIASEYGPVASVYTNRLRIGMLLQADPTVIYPITEGGGVLGRKLLLKDLELDSPYNTYKYPGLPPTPIANPGRAAVEAALNPAKTSYLYFVATGNGGHNFARTLDEHNRNVVQYRQILKDKKEE